MNKYVCSGRSDIGVDRENQEDFLQFKELDDDNILCVIADGTGSRPKYPQPAPIAVDEIIDYISSMFKERKDIFLTDPEYFLYKSMLSANKLLGAFKMGNEEIFSGYAASVTCCLLGSNRSIYIAHAGNTRLYILRSGRLIQLTHDHTKGRERLEAGEIDLETYYIHPDRLKMTSGIGVVLDPKIQTSSGHLKENDLVLMTTDGIHYAITQEAMETIILESQDSDVAAGNLIQAAKEIVKYPDNMSAMVIYQRKFER